MEWSPKTTPLLWDCDSDSPAPETLAANTSSSSSSLRLGKRAYFENTAAGGEPPVKEKKAKVVAAAAVAAAAAAGEARCQVEGCGADLAAAKDYHRKHRVCEAHSKCPRVVVAGQERRFCQQCSRFHALSEFDQKKRSCRRRLSDHNARRRKPQPNAFSFGSAGLPSSFFDDRRQISFVWNKTPLGHVKPFTCSSWESLSDFKLPQVKEIGEKTLKFGAVNGQLHLAKSQLSNVFPTLRDDIDELMPIKGPEASVTDSKSHGAPDLQRALSLLSASSWGFSDPVQASSLIQFTDANQNSGTPPVLHGGNSASPFWVDGQTLAPQPQVVQFTMHASSNTFQELQRIKTSYETTLFDTNQMQQG